MKENEKESEEKGIHMTREKKERFNKFIMGDDLDFYEEYVINLTDEGQEEFFRDHPDFMSEFPVSRERIYLLKDQMFRSILRKIKKYNDENKSEK